MKIRIAKWIALVAVVFLSGCATKPAPYDYSAYHKARPASLLVMPPLNDSPDVKGTSAVWAQAVRPLAEAGYYVLPVTLVEETLRGNGVHSANDAHDIPYQKLRDVFGADAAVYIRVAKYGTSYKVVASETEVEVEARIVDLRTGVLLWQGKAAASSAEQSQQQQGGLVGLLVAAVVKQVLNTTADTAFGYAGVADARLLGVRYNGVPAGPRSPLHGQGAESR
jgi:hypothetical protein